jgi:AAA domain/DnaB-like helicase N terminal domain
MTAPFPPIDLDAEHAVLGGALQPADGRAMLTLVAAALDVTDFYTEAHRTIYRRMLALRAAGHPVDQITLAAALREHDELDAVGGPPKLAQLFDAGLFAIPANIPSYLATLLEQSRKRTLGALGERMLSAARNGRPADTMLADVAETVEGIRARRACRGPDEAGDTPTPTIEVIDAADLVTRTFPEEPALVGGGLIVPRSLVVNGGPAKRGKSLLVLNREIRRAQGRPFLGFPTTPGRTLYINAEIPEPQLQQRLVLMLGDCPVAGPVDAETLRTRLLTVTHRGLFIDEPAGYDAVRRLIEQTKPDLLSLDPLARFMTGEENSARDVGQLIKALDRLIQEYRIAIELTHHAGKPSTGDPRQGGQRLRGSSALFGAADTVTMLDRAQDSWLLSFELRHAEELAPMPLDRTSSLWFTKAGPPRSCSPWATS